ncbi:hypothetical protein GMLC_14790 [Geomonas limicola]|uniref:Lipoprotein n=1 Tax=Geomonas limicola TaxID=2740186 RepID=A0A6V8N674_9BACT|nr:hypothetical protein [Geomonas limicola]GFO67900.1 hypothetical protein GMLC_14790 [Geomonas limicola]
MRPFLLAVTLISLAGCGGRLTGYNLKATLGHTDYQDGNTSIYTGASIDAHFDVLPAR